VTIDPGVSAERTRLAWRRTALSGTAVALLAARPALANWPAGAALLGVTLLGWVALVAVSFRRVRGMRPGHPPVRRVLGLAALVVGYAALGVAAVAVSDLGAAP
jgi:hypothetical protein